MRKLLLLLILGGVLYLSRGLWTPVLHKAGTLHGVPLQTATQRKPFQLGAYQITPRAEYQMEAHVLSSKDYTREDRGDLVPQDLALGWGPMADEKFAASFSISQSDRFAYLETEHIWNFPQSVGKIANVHIIPATPQIRAYLATLGAGEYVSLSGCLVDFQGPTGGSTTSLSRMDMGEGACEIFYVERASRISPDRTLLSSVGLPSAPPPSQAASPASARRAATPTIARKPSPTPAQPHILPRTLLVRLEHGSLTIPAQSQILILNRQQGRANISYQGFTAWVDSASLQ